jgi:hypothetical protein
MKFKEEWLNTHHSRIKVYGGWIVKEYSINTDLDVHGYERQFTQSSMVFVPDAEHKWEINE